MKPVHSKLASRYLRLSVSLACVLAGLNGCGNGSTGTASNDGSSLKTAGETYLSPLDAALATGDSSGVEQATIKQAAYALLDGQIAAYKDIQQALFQNVGPIDWNPSHDSIWFTIKDSARNQIMLPSNWRYSDSKTGRQMPLAVVGKSPLGDGRYAAFGGNPIAVPGNAAMDQYMLNTVGWLSSRASSGSFKVVTAHLPGTETYWFPHEKKVRDWFYAKYPGVTVNGVGAGVSQPDNKCDGVALAGCLQGADLLVIGREEGPSYQGDAVEQAVRTAQANGIPVLYLHNYTDAKDLATRMLNYFGLGYNSNYWDQEGYAGLDPATLPNTPQNLVSIRNMLSHLAQGDFSTTWSGCTTSGRINCSGDATYMAEFGTPAGNLRAALRDIDASGVPMFGQPGYELEKLLVLQGDKVRAGVAYPIDKSSKAKFHRAYYADVTAYINRGSNAVAQNLGTYSPMIPVTTPVLSQTVSVAPPLNGAKEYLTGLYVIPGKSVTLTRNDGGTGKVSFGLNMLRDTTWAFNTNGLDRPTQIASPHIQLVANKPVTITSPYGGPLILFLETAGANDPAVSVKVDGVITHPVLRDANNADEVAAFQAAVNSTPTNWVGFATDALTLHSTLTHFKESMARYNNDMAALASDTWNYTIKDTYELAGYNFTGQLQLAPSVAAVCNAKGWDCTGTQHTRNYTQHVISDARAKCGDGCSGNPYDQDWAFQPLGWGESHEIGHGIQPGRLMIYGGASGEVSNNLFPMHKQMKFNGTPAGQAAPIKSRVNAGPNAFATLKAALGGADPVTAAYQSIWVNGDNSTQVMFYRQLAEYARYYNPQFSDAWEVHTLMYLLDRNMSKYASSWPTVAGSYGFGTYASYPSSMSGNDFMLIASSNLIGRDMRPMFALWGITYSDAANAQVSAYGLPAAQQLFFPMNDVVSPTSSVGQPVVMSASANYPAGY